MKKKSWRITNNRVDDILVMQIYGFFDQIRFKSCLSKVLGEGQPISGIIFQLNTFFVLTNDDILNLICSLDLRVMPPRIALIAPGKEQDELAKILQGSPDYKDTRIKICFNGQSAIEWVVANDKISQISQNPSYAA